MGDLTMRRFPSMLLAALLLALAVFLMVAAVRGWTTISFDCNNEVGECISRRQKLAIDAIAFFYTVAALLVACLGIVVVRRAQVATVHVAALIVGTALAVVFFAVDPTEHLNNSLTGWLASPPR